MMPDLTGIEMGGVLTSMSGVVAVGMPIAIGIIGLRKGTSFLFSFFKK